MQPVTSLNQANFQASQHAGGMRRARGNYNGAAAAWLWLFDTNGQPLSTSPGLLVPTPLYPSAPFFIETELGSLQFYTGLYAAVSSTQETYTASASTMDITIEMDDPEEPSGNSYAGDTVTGVDSLNVYAAGSPAGDNLYAITASNGNAATCYLQLFTFVPAAGAVPFLQWTVAAGASLALKFGRQGLHPTSILAGVEYDGVFLKGSSTAGAYTATTGSLWKMQAEFGAPQNG